jgi:hypothetical protein
MSESDTSPVDLLDAILTAQNRPAADASLREALLAQTVGVIRFRRRLRRCAVAGAMAVCYAAGAFTMGMWTPNQSNPSPQPTEQVAKERQSQATPEPQVVPAATGGQQRRSAPVKKIDRFDALRIAGDRSLLEYGDVKAALHDYKRALALATAEQRAISPGQDTWLLMALKDAHMKENLHARYSD